ncbi:MAG: hypothetical protein DME17_10295 [Candidatus Rokuibacteriota bacterium]|nr:MAG: hypothetical protein DME17_10295 [Candidatus Rokubacteria bacterium]
MTASCTAPPQPAIRQVVSERVTLVMCLYNQLALTRACLASLRETTEPFRLVVIDNGSTDGTREFLQRFEAPYPLWIISSESNASVIASLNRAWQTAETEFLCLLHNDTELLEPEWLARLLRSLAEPGVGLAGLYGAKRIRKDGRSHGRRSRWSTGSAFACPAPSWNRSAVSTKDTGSSTGTTRISPSPSAKWAVVASSCTHHFSIAAAARARGSSAQTRSRRTGTSRFATR